MDLGGLDQGDNTHERAWGTVNRRVPFGVSRGNIQRRPHHNDHPASARGCMKVTNHQNTSAIVAPASTPIGALGTLICFPFRARGISVTIVTLSRFSVMALMRAPETVVALMRAHATVVALV